MILRRAALAVAAVVAMVCLYAAAITLYAPPVSPIAPRVVDLCARPPAERPVACDAPPGSDGDVTLLFAGDTAEIDAALPILAARGLDHPFIATAERVRAADLAVLNVEAPITDGGDPFPLWKDFLYRAPSGSAAAIARAGFDVADLANNHAFDYGVRGLGDTEHALAAVGVEPIGAGASEAEARRGLVLRVGALRVGLLAVCERELSWDVYLRQFALGRRPGVAALDADDLRADVARLRRDSDVVILLAHWGDNYAPPVSRQLGWAEYAARSGVDLVVGHHPHVAQGVASWGGVPVALSVGNYAFGTEGHADLDAGILLTATVRGRRIARLDLWPIDVQNRRVEYQPRPMTGAAAERVLERLARDSAARGTTLDVAADHATLVLPPRG